MDLLQSGSGGDEDEIYQGEVEILYTQSNQRIFNFNSQEPQNSFSRNPVMVVMYLEGIAPNIDNLIALTSQGRYLFHDLDETVKENLQIVSKNKNDMITLLKKFGMEDFLNTKVYKLSGGEQQRVALVRVMLKDPQIILADEPTASMDKENAQIVIESLKELNEQGKTVVVVTHDQGLLPNFKRVIDLNAQTKNVLGGI